MTGKTHVVGGNVFALGSYILMKKTGLLVDSVWEPLQLGIILPYATWASTLPDLDQNNKNRVETNPINSVIQDFFRIIQAGHRSVKSHVAPCVIAGVLCIMSILGKSFFNLNQISTNILFLVLTGLFCGLLSHLILDLCTNKGVIAKIVPEEEMPYDPVSGKSLDILLNPLGIPSRMNISQLYEVGLGAAEHKENKISIVNVDVDVQLGLIMFESALYKIGRCLMAKDCLIFEVLLLLETQIIWCLYYSLYLMR